MAAEDTRPWYREWMLWIVIAPPLAAVLGGLATAFVAGGPPSMVVDDYRDFAMVTRRAAERDNAAARLQLSATLTLDAGADAVPVRLRLISGAGASLPADLQLTLIHPTRADLDQAVALRLERGAYRGLLVRPAGSLDVIVEPPSAEWRLTGRLPAGAGELVLERRAVEARGG